MRWKFRMEKCNLHIKLSKVHTLDDDFVKRSDSISYLNTLKHSSRSSRNSAYVRTQAEQSQATKRNLVWECNVTILKITILSVSKSDYWSKNKIKNKYQESLSHLWNWIFGGCVLCTSNLEAPLWRYDLPLSMFCEWLSMSL